MPTENIKAIREIKRALQEVGVSAVAQKMGITRHGVYYHLNEDRADKVSLPHLQQIAEAIQALKAESASATKQIIKTIKDA